MDVSADRLPITVIVATGFAVLLGGWVASLVHAEATDIEGIVLRIGIGVVLFAAMAVARHRFGEMDRDVE